MIKPNRNGQQARNQAFARSDGKCQFCGLCDAEEAHHWGYPKYPRESHLMADDLTALCKPCHQIATFIRRIHTMGYAVADFYTAVTVMVERLFNKNADKT